MKKSVFIKWLLIGGLLLLTAVLGWFSFRPNQKADAVSFMTYTVHPVSDQGKDILVRGILQSADIMPATVKNSGRIIALLPQGAQVRKGDVLFQMDDTNARETIETQETALFNSDLTLVKLHTQFDLVEFQEEQTIKQRKAQLDHALLQQQEELASPKPRQRRIMQIEEELSKLDVADAQDNYDREAKLFQKGYISQSALEPYEQKLENAKSVLQELILQNKLTLKGITDERRVELDMAVKRAKSNMERRERRKERRVNDIQSQINAEELNKKAIQHIIDHEQKAIAQSVVKAQSDGVFQIRTYRDWAGGGLLREIAVGDEKSPQDIVGDVIDPTHMIVKLVIHEADYHYLQNGMDVELEMPTIAQKRFHGKIQQIGVIGRDRNRVDPTALGSGDSDISMFNAAISFDGQGVQFHPGMSATIRIILKKPQERLLIPRAAVKTDRLGQFTVSMDDQSTRVIRGYYFNETSFEVTEGLQPGDVLRIASTQGVL